MINLSLGMISHYDDPVVMVEAKIEYASRCFNGQISTHNACYALSSDALKVTAFKRLSEAIDICADPLVLSSIVDHSVGYNFHENAQKALNKSLEISNNEEQALLDIFYKASELRLFSICQSILSLRVCSDLSNDHADADSFKRFSEAIDQCDDLSNLLNIADQANVFKFSENAQKALNKSLEISNNEEQALSKIFDKAFEFSFFSICQDILKTRVGNIKSASFAQKLYEDSKTVGDKEVCLEALKIWFEFLKDDENAKKEDFNYLSRQADQLEDLKLANDIFSHSNRL